MVTGSKWAAGPAQAVEWPMGPGSVGRAVGSARVAGWPVAPGSAVGLADSEPESATGLAVGLERTGPTIQRGLGSPLPAGVGGAVVRRLALAARSVLSPGPQRWQVAWKICAHRLLSLQVLRDAAKSEVPLGVSVEQDGPAPTCATHPRGKLWVGRYTSQRAFGGDRQID